MLHTSGFLDPGATRLLLPGPQGLGGAYLTIQEAVEDGHHETLGRKGEEVRQTDLESPKPCPTHVPLDNQRAKCRVGA